MPAAEYDVFLSHAWIDGEIPQHIADALTEAGLRVWIDAAEIKDFASITRAVTEGLAKSKALVAYYSKNYPLRRACQWELTAAYLAGQAEGDPRERVLVINPEKGAGHIHPVELRDGKFSTAPKNDGDMARLVSSIVNHLESIDGPLTDIHPLFAPSWFGMTPVGSTRFVGRLKEMWRIHSALHAGDVAQITGIAAATSGIGQVQGLGGIGKSLLVEEYALRFGAAYPGGIFWLRAYGNDDAKGALMADELEALRVDQLQLIAEQLGIRTEGRKAREIEGELGHTIAKEAKACLWVVDDVPAGLEGNELRRWFAPHTLARTLLTTRSREYGALAQEIDISVLTPEEALQLLTSRRKLEGSDEEDQARELTNDLGCHALALDVTASALQSYAGNEPYRTFRAELRHYGDDALELASELADVLPNGHERSIVQTLLRSIRSTGMEGQDLLRLATAFAVAPIPGSLVTEVFERADTLEHREAEQRQRRAFSQVTKASLAEMASENKEARSVHTLVSRAMLTQERSAPDRTRALVSAAVRALTRRLGNVSHIGEHSRIAMDIPHARQMVATELQTAHQAELALRVASLDHERGDYSSARQLEERVLEACLRTLDKEHPVTLTAMGCLALTLNTQGELAQAWQLQEQVLKARLRVLGEEHPDALTAMNNLAHTLHAQGDLTGARNLQEQVLTTRLRVLGEEHLDTLTVMSNLAETLSAQGDLATARKLQEQVLTTRLRVLGEEHPDTLTAMNNLAGTMKALGALPEARKFGEQVLAARIRVFGEAHPDTWAAMNNLAETLSSQGDLATARTLQEQVLAGWLRILGEEHPDTLTAMSNLALTHYRKGDLPEAKSLQEQVLTGFCHALGEVHPNSWRQ